MGFSTFDLHSLQQAAAEFPDTATPGVKIDLGEATILGGMSLMLIATSTDTAPINVTIWLYDATLTFSVPVGGATVPALAGVGSVPSADLLAGIVPTPQGNLIWGPGAGLGVSPNTAPGSGKALTVVHVFGAF